MNVADWDTSDIENDTILDVVSRFLLAALLKHCGLTKTITSSVKSVFSSVQFDVKLRSVILFLLVNESMNPFVAFSGQS